MYKKADKDFGILVKGLPGVVYETPIEGSAAEFTEFSRDFFEIKNAMHYCNLSEVLHGIYVNRRIV